MTTQTAPLATSPDTIFHEGNKVVDGDGWQGPICGVTEYEGSRWYTVRLPGGPATRFASDLTLVGGYSRRGN